MRQVPSGTIRVRMLSARGRRQFADFTVAAVGLRVKCRAPASRAPFRHRFLLVRPRE